MSEKTDKKTVKKSGTKSGKWDKTQRYGFWALIISMALFWGGVAFGTQATLNSQAHEAQVKTQAVEEYKASLESK